MKGLSLNLFPSEKKLSSTVTAQLDSDRPWLATETRASLFHNA